MSNRVVYRGNQGSNVPNTGRGASPYVWADLPPDIHIDNNVGLFFRDDFINPYLTTPTTQGVWPPYKAFTSTGGTLLPATPAWGGILTLGSDGDDEGASIMSVGTPFQISLSHGKFWFEARVKVDTIADTKYDMFVGMAEAITLSATVPITATAGAMADVNFVGFHRLGTDGDKFDTRYKADGVTAVTVGADAYTLVADTYVKVGMKFDPADGYLRFYFNGVEAADKKLIPSAAGTDFPNDVLLSPCIAVLNAAAVTSVGTIDWWQYAQLAV
jgi:hypothetical protein